MSTCVCVLSNNGERLMPTFRLGKVRHLLKDGKAKIVKHHPFTIQLLYDSKTNTQPIEICEDVGYNYIGISAKSQSHEYVSAQYDTLQDEKACHVPFSRMCGQNLKKLCRNGAICPAIRPNSKPEAARSLPAGITES